ncbi:hypothetical protein J2Y69_002720 [Microbacterium resistens]|uniref:Amino acid deaminase n=1 Tax=Microbacterium resistens TaxID=156977 RepID=A0ABU1SES1_9MICO|nr:amino acid deaminase [Microbacterium resistens]MDR6868109.1 hypothetical protein [Microbacterium resistens]
MAPIDDLVRAAERASADTPDAALAALDSLPWLLAAIDDDRRAGRFARWGLSSAIDGDTDLPVIGPALFDALHERAGLDATWPAGNAGLLHCYGFLLSTTPTPYGLGRDRWLDGRLATALGLDAALLLPWTGPGTLLERATGAAANLLDGGELAWYAPAAGRATRTSLSAERSGVRAIAYAVAPAPGAVPLLVTMFPVADAAALRRELDEAPARLRWNAL